MMHGPGNVLHPVQHDAPKVQLFAIIVTTGLKEQIQLDVVRTKTSNISQVIH